jgi:hypothetical protein
VWCDTDVDLDELRLAVYGSFVTTGRAPDERDLSVALGAGADEVRTGLRDLHDARHVVLDDNGSVRMAHPFSAVPLGFSVMGKQTLWWGGCAWDSFALPHLLPDDREVLVATTCPACHAPHAWNVSADAPPDDTQVAYFLIPVAHMWDDVVRTCGHQRIFCDRACVERWLERTGHDEGYMMDLDRLWHLARGWYAGRLDPGYERRDPASAGSYFASVGLTGPFWQIA